MGLNMRKHMGDCYRRFFRISFDETRCQGEPVCWPSIEAVISAMLVRVEQIKLFKKGAFTKTGQRKTHQP